MNRPLVFLLCCFGLLLQGLADTANAQSPAPAVARPQGLPPTHKDIDYAPAEPAGTNGHKLDLYVLANPGKPVPLVIWTRGSAWLADNGRDMADILAARLNPLGYAVAGVSIRSSAQVKFPGQLYDIKAAIRYLRANAAKFNIDPNRIGIVGTSSGGWTSLMAAVAGDVPQMEGNVGVTGGSSEVQVAVAFFPPTNFLAMDTWALQRCQRPGGFCHDAADSPESKLVDCAIQTCPDRVHAADPHTYITERDPPIMILHGDSDPLVPHNQGESFYMALNKACHDAVFITLPRAGHGEWFNFLANDQFREAAVMRSTASQGCSVTNPVPYTPTWKTLTDFLDKHLKAS
jgi:acetyl esterase/lipase